MNYKGSKLKAVSEIESKRLEDLKHSRDTIFKYAIPASLTEAIVGAVTTLVTTNVWMLLPFILILILTFFLAYRLDQEKYEERQDIIRHTTLILQEIREQERQLLRTSVMENVSK